MELLLVIAAVLLWHFSRQSQGGGVAGSSSPTSNPVDDNPLDNLTEAWARWEGYYKQGSVAQRNNNPMNVKGNWPGVVGHTASGIAIFDDPGDGWDAGSAWVKKQAAQHPDWSFSNLFGKVLGDLNGNPVNNEQGDSEAEASYVANYLGVPVASEVADYLGMS
jgi:hypothetical protein